MFCILTIESFAIWWMLGFEIATLLKSKHIKNKPIHIGIKIDPNDNEHLHFVVIMDETDLNTGIYIYICLILSI